MTPDVWWMWVPVAYALWDNIRAPSAILLLVIIFLLWRRKSRRDFYVVRHLGFDLVFNEHPGASYVTAARGPLIGGFSESFSEFGAAKAFFDRIERPSMGGTEEVNQIFVVRGRKPLSMNSSTAPRAFVTEPGPAAAAVGVLHAANRGPNAGDDFACNTDPWAIARRRFLTGSAAHSRICPDPGHCVQDVTVRFRAEGPSAP
jgi:hypothetical protein